MWWSDMAMCLYPAFIGAGDACERLDLCKVREWTCDDCTAVMTRVAEFMKQPDTIAEGVSVLTVRYKICILYSSTMMSCSHGNIA